MLVICALLLLSYFIHNTSNCNVHQFSCNWCLQSPRTFLAVNCFLSKSVQSFHNDCLLCHRNNLKWNIWMTQELTWRTFQPELSSFWCSMCLTCVRILIVNTCIPSKLTFGLCKNLPQSRSCEFSGVKIVLKVFQRFSFVFLDVFWKLFFPCRFDTFHNWLTKIEHYTLLFHAIESKCPSIIFYFQWCRLM